MRLSRYGRHNSMDAVTTPQPVSGKVPLSVFCALVFVLFATWLNLCGWILSGVHALNAAGYAFCLLLFFSSAGFVLRRGRFGAAALLALTRWRRRVLRPLPALWLLAFVLAFAGGLFFEPRNYDFLTYRLSRILHWWAEGRWHWITTNNDRMNISGPGFEWVLTPFVILTHSARPAALLNLLSFGLMPGLLFRSLTALRVRPSVAYQWMWLFPGGYCFVTQAGSAGNDAYAVTYLLAGITFALEADRTRNVAWLYASILAAALLTGVKASNIPLIVPVVTSWWPVRKLLFRRITLLVAVVAVAALSSFAPVAIANHLLTGQWAGDAGGASGLQIFNPIAGAIGNLLQLAVNTLLSPFVPFASLWSNVVAPRILQLPFGTWLRHGFPRLDLTVREVASEENVGIGLGVAVLWIVLAARRVIPHAGTASVPSRSWPVGRMPVFLSIAGLLSLGVFLAKMGSEAGPRLLAPYYLIFLIVVLLFAGSRHPRLRGAWLGFCVVVQSVPVLLLLVEPNRHLLPVSPIAHFVMHSPNALLARIDVVYSTYQSRADVLAPLRDLIPSEATTVGFIADPDEPEVSLWRPFGSRRQVVDVVDLEKRESLPDYCVVLNSWIEEARRMPLGEWAQLMRLHEVGRRTISMRAHDEPQIWAVLTKVGPPPAEAEAAAKPSDRSTDCQTIQSFGPRPALPWLTPVRFMEGKSGSGCVLNPRSCFQ
ncbi:MAG: hypothetical protein JO015_08545 [Verrucomicrobia bacterium]|nr:hypothetical protein [Verrucomicrobiota bacterium]